MKTSAFITTLLPLANKVCIDSRTIKKGQVFFAIVGADLDGHNYVHDALNKGAAYVVVSKKLSKISAADKSKIITVPDTAVALGELARAYRYTLPIPVIGIAGSNGKTTTKELIREVLATTYNVHASPNSFNNHIGVPMTILSITKKHEIAVIELGSNHPGELEYVCNIAHPTHAIVTSIGKEHLEGFKNIAGVVREETAIYRYVQKKNGVLLVSSTIPELQSWQKLAPITYGAKTDSVFVKKIDTYFPAVSCTISDSGKPVAIKSQLSGSVNNENILLSYVIGKYFSVPIPKIKSAIAQYRPAMLRSMMLTRGGSKYFVDCYNANPTSMKFTLSDFIATNHRQKIAIIGGMRELGRASATEHSALATLARTGKFTHTYFVGTEFAGLRKKLLKNETWFESYAECKEFLKQNPIPKNSFVCIKGSKGIKLWRLLDLPDPS